MATTDTASGSVFERGDSGRFTGEVWVRSGPAAEDGTNVGVVHFAPGARTHWHRHPAGQFLIGLTGRGRIRSRGGLPSTLEPGDILHVTSEEWHFHAAQPDAPMVHVAVNGGGAPEWGEPVSDDEYAEGVDP